MLRIKEAMKGVVLAVALSAMAAVGVLAQGQEERKVEFYLDGKVGTELIKRGNYKISYPEAAEGTLEVKVGKKVITVPFTRRELNEEASTDKMTYRENSDGTRSIATITPRGKKYTLVLGESRQEVGQ